MKTRNEHTVQCDIDESLGDGCTCGANKPQHTVAPTASHTPTPWTLQRNDDLVIVGPPDSDGDYRFIANVDSLQDQTSVTPEQREADKANAAFIVRAVNSHEELLAELETAYAGLHQAWNHEGYFKACKVTSCAASKVFLAKAEGR